MLVLIAVLIYLVLGALMYISLQTPREDKHPFRWGAMLAAAIFWFPIWLRVLLVPRGRDDSLNREDGP